jgi:hypothetical protein
MLRQHIAAARQHCSSTVNLQNSAYDAAH